MHNFPAVVTFQTLKIPSGQPAVSFNDAPLSHWEQCVRAANLSRVQVRGRWAPGVHPIGIRGQGARRGEACTCVFAGCVGYVHARLPTYLYTLCVCVLVRTERARACTRLSSSAESSQHPRAPISHSNRLPSSCPSPPRPASSPLLQALLLVDMNNMFQARLAACTAERAHLHKLLEAAMEAEATGAEPGTVATPPEETSLPPPTAAAAAATARAAALKAGAGALSVAVDEAREASSDSSKTSCSTDPLSCPDRDPVEFQLSVMEAFEENLASERAAFMLFPQCMRAVFRPHQFSRVSEVHLSASQLSAAACLLSSANRPDGPAAAVLCHSLSRMHAFSCLMPLPLMAPLFLPHAPTTHAPVSCCMPQSRMHSFHTACPYHSCTLFLQHVPITHVPSCLKYLSLTRPLSRLTAPSLPPPLSPPVLPQRSCAP